MNDKDVLLILEKYEKKELETESNYNIKKAELDIKKEELEKEYKKQQIENKFELLNILSQKIEETKKKYDELIQVRNALYGNDENEIMKEMSKEKKETFENSNNRQGIHLREHIDTNGMIKTTDFAEEKEGKEGKDQEDESEEKEGKEQEDESEKKELKMISKKKKRTKERDNN